jgi:hypothetical protein
VSVTEIHSGGQTGGDQGGLKAALTLGIKTGGVAPKGYRTQAGKATWLKKLGLIEHTSWSYPPRTKANVKNTDGTLIFGNPWSKGCGLTQKACGEFDKPFLCVEWKTGDSVPDSQLFLTWVKSNSIRVLNVAGNREEIMPGIFDAVHDFLVEALKE